MDDFLNRNENAGNETEPEAVSLDNTGAETSNFENTDYDTSMGANNPVTADESPSFGTSPQSGFSPEGNAPGPQSAPQYNSYSPYGSTPYGGASQPPFGSAPIKPQKNGSKTGKIIFAVLICICIVISSIAIGFSVNGGINPGNTAPTSDSQKTGDTENTTGTGADPYIEDSPLTSVAYSGSGKMTASQVYDAVKDINVGVIVYTNSQKAGEGSGIIVGEDKTGTYTYILTCAHVISDNGISVQVQFNNDSEMDAEIVGFDTKTDIGVIKVKTKGLPKATFGNASKLTVGQTVYAIGNPGGTEFFGSFTTGLVSALDRPVDSPVGYELPCIQHSASINPGNSGGALVNEYGQVIGINSSKIADTDYEGMGFAIPSSTALEIYNEIVVNGYVTNRPKLGITYSAVASSYSYSAIAWQNDLPYGSVVIAEINSDSDLSDKNIKSGDIITAVNGKELDTTDVLLDAIQNSKVGDTLTLSICRLNNNGSVNSKFDVKVKLVEDRGNTATTPAETTTDPFSSYFGGGY